MRRQELFSLLANILRATDAAGHGVVARLEDLGRGDERPLRRSGPSAQAGPDRSRRNLLWRAARAHGGKREHAAKPIFSRFSMVLPRGIEPPTPSLPRTCSTPELRQHRAAPCHRACGARKLSSPESSNPRRGFHCPTYSQHHVFPANAFPSPRLDHRHIAHP